jgi:monoamine oxidase
MVGFPKLKNYTRFLYEAPLLRIYAKYKTPWFKDLHRITTNNILRQIIPIGDGIIMVSYTDGKDTEPFIPLLKKEKELIHLIQTNLSLLFPEHTIPYPEYIVPYFWEVGTHAWKPGANSDRMYEEVIHPYENVYVCGEAYSKHQAWMEGALNMAQDVLSKIESS